MKEKEEEELKKQHAVDKLKKEIAEKDDQLNKEKSECEELRKRLKKEGEKKKNLKNSMLPSHEQKRSGGAQAEREGALEQTKFCILKLILYGCKSCAIFKILYFCLKKRHYGI